MSPAAGVPPVRQGQADDELDAAVFVAPREHVAEAAHEGERRLVAVRDERPDAEDPSSRARSRSSATSRLPMPWPCQRSTTSKAISASGASGSRT